MTNYLNFMRHKNIMGETRKQSYQRRLLALEVNVRRISVELSEIHAIMGRNSFRSLLASLEEVERQREVIKERMMSDE